MAINAKKNAHSRKTLRGVAVTCCAATLYAVSAHADEAAAGPKDTLVIITDTKEAAEKNKHRYQTSDQYRFSKNQAKPPERDGLPVTVRRNQHKVFALDTPVQKFGVIAFTTAAGQPLAGLSAAGQRADFVRGGIPLLGGQYVGKRLCLTAIVPGDTGKLVVWNALADGFADSVQGRLTMRNYAPEKPDTLKTGRTVWSAKAGRAKEYRVKQELEQTVVIWLQAHTGVLYVPPRGGRVMYYGGEEGARHTIEPEGGSLFLFGWAEGGGSAGNVELEAYAPLPRLSSDDAWGSGSAQLQTLPAPCSPPQCELSSGMEIIRQPSVYTGEIIRVKNEPFAHRRLYFSGSVEGAEWISQAGQMTLDVTSGSGLSGESGILAVRYAPGRAGIRLCRDDGGILGLNECRWGEGVKKWGEAPLVKGMAKTVLAEGVNWYSVELSEPAHAALRAPFPAAAAIAVDGKIRDYEEFEEALQWDIPLAQGKFTIGVKPLAHGSAAGVPLTIGFYPISALTEKQPFTTYLMPGQKRMAAFEVKKKGNTGLWMAASDEAAEAALMDRSGKKISGGRQIFAELDKGKYYVLLSAPAVLPPALSAGGGIDVKLHLFGHDGP
jgi:hypothetical protein